MIYTFLSVYSFCTKKGGTAEIITSSLVGRGFFVFKKVKFDLLFILNLDLAN